MEQVPLNLSIEGVQTWAGKNAALEKAGILNVEESKVGIKFDGGKARIDLVPTQPLLDIAEILTIGAEKYSERNWEKGMPWGKVYASLQRHMFAWWAGEDLDPETGKSHLAHAGCNIIFLLEFLKTHPELDTRPRRENN